MITIKDIAHIQTGIYEKPVAFGEIFYVQARHFDDNRQFLDTVTPELHFDKKLEKHFLQKGDVLVAAKGYDHFAVAYQGIAYPAVASSMFIVLRLQTPALLPDFLAWFINHPKTQAVLSGSAKGTALPSLNKSDIGDLIIPIPPLEKQDLILNIEKLRHQELALKKQIEALKYAIIQETIFKHLEKNSV